jgi:hypothetical protein
MSKAFDTIDRNKLMKILSDDVGLEEDELRMCQVLLAETSLQVKLKEILSAPFDTTIGSPQGDGMSPMFFAVYLERALRNVREIAPLRPQVDNGLPSELIYADDVDIVTKEKERAQEMKAIIPPTIGKAKLKVNESKWEETEVNGEAKDEEAWKRVKKLGSLLGDDEDVQRRMELANIQFRKLAKVWEHENIRLNTRLRTYNAFVVPVLLYNAGTWGLCESSVRKLEVYHRAQLRKVLGVRWPFKVSNEDLYKRCRAEPLGLVLRFRRWNLFGHVLRLPLDTPAQLAMDYYCQQSRASDVKKQRGRAQVTLPVLLFNEFNVYKQEERAKRGCKSNYRQEITNALGSLRKLAQDRLEWAQVVRDVCELGALVKSLKQRGQNQEE